MALADTEPGGVKVRAFTTVVSAIGLAVFAYSVYSLITGPLNLEWGLLFLVTILLVSRIDIGIPKTSSAVTLSDTFLFISILLYGPYPSVVLAGVDAAICSLQFKMRRRIIWFNAGVMSLSVFVASTAVTLGLGDLRTYASNLGRLFIAGGLLALVHYPLNTGLVSVGRNADFIVLDANPLERIANTRRIADVYLRGQRVDRARLRARWRPTT